MSLVLSSLNVQTVLVGIVVILLVYKLCQRWKYKLPPGPFAWPVIGNYEVIRAKFLHEIFATYIKTYGPVFTVQLGPFQMVVLNDIESVTEALVKRKADFANRPYLPSLVKFSNGRKNIVFANYTPTWKLHRKIAGKAFSTELDDPEFQHLMKIDREFTEMIGKGFVEDMFPIMLKIWTTQKYRKITEIFEETTEIFRQKLKEHEKSFNRDNIRDFTDSLILARQEAEDEEDKEVISQLTDTHLVQTLSDIFGGKNRLPGVSDRENLSFTDATLHEVMRLGTAVPVGIPHSTLCDSKVGGYDVPEDTIVMINHWALHHDPNYWKDVDKFDPTRFLDEKNKLARKPESWLPFSAGRRVCLGESVAKPELHIMFASIMQRFKISLPEGTTPELEIAGGGTVAQPAPFKIIVEERK
ncbi:cytochrome P450 2U1-like isoform X2 [Mytilus californianus]|uniref:cytochrome P450 2U1-like isoform X2 n=1 Tax=Mytilus californianus TaxID=6549 RepID=UPI002245A30D|nr:cytochrome P450 2U1-like isoform X2 [Mytilus californianus]